MTLFNLSALAVRERSVTLFLLLLAACVGLFAFLTLGRAEDPSFRMRALVVSAAWPGATAEQMQQVADPLEKQIQEIDYFYKMETTARPGRVDLLIEFREYAPGEVVPQLFYEVRKRMLDVAPQLPAGVLGPFVNDEFVDVYFSLYALTAPGVPQRLIIEEAERLRDQLNRVPGVQKAHLIGERPQRVFVELDNQRMATLGIPVQRVAEALEAYNRLLPAGQIETDGPRLYWRIDADLARLDAIRQVPIRVGDRLIQLGDIATVRRGFEEPPEYMVRSDGEDAILLGVVMQRGENGLDLGERLAAAQRDIAENLPLGMQFTQLINQADVIDAAINLFQIKFLMAVGVVMLVSFLVLGWRPGLIVGVAVPLTLGLTFLAMLIRGIDLDRVSLGALIVGLGLLVDDAIIAIEMMLVKMEEGWDRVLAASHAWTVTAAPMLTGTLVTIIGFVPIGFAESAVGEYAGGIFWVLAYALLASWLVAVVFTPYLGVKLLRVPQHTRPAAAPAASAGATTQPPPATAPADHYQTPAYRRLRHLIRYCMVRRKRVVAVTFAALLLGVALLAGPIEQQFFPASDRPEVLVDIYLPQGSSISATDKVARRVESVLREHAAVQSLATYVGAGSPRFFITLNPQQPNPAFARLVAVTANETERNKVIADLRERITQGEFADALVRVHTVVFGPPAPWPVMFRVTGPDPLTLRQQAEQVRAVVANHANTINAHLEWGERVPAMRLVIDPDRLRQIGLTPQALAQQLQMELDGVPVTELREGTRSIALVLRGRHATDADTRAQRSPADIQVQRSPADIQVKTLDGRSVSLEQAGIIRIEMEEPVIKRFNRELFIAVNADVRGAEAPEVMNAIWRELQPLRAEMPRGYDIAVSGVNESSATANSSIARVIPVMVGLMLLVIMLQMRSFAGTLMVLATAPLGIIGAALALLLSGNPFGFVALLGLIGLAGILMRNTLILAQQTRDNIEAGMPRGTAMVEATVRRARPVLLTALAAVFAFVPLATDAFWGPLAFVLIGGTLVGTAITLLFLPALYALWYRVRIDDGA